MRTTFCPWWVIQGTSFVSHPLLTDARKGGDSIPGRVRAYYTKHYKVIDQFDQYLAEIRLPYKFMRWELSYMWWLIEICIVEAWVAWCEYKSERIPVKKFVSLLLQCIVDYITKMI